MISLNINTETNISLNNYIINSINIFKYTPRELHKYVIDKCNENPLIYIKDDRPLPDRSSVNADNDIVGEITAHFNYTLKSSDKKIMDVIIGSLSPKGFLESSPEEISSITNAGLSKVQRLINALKDYDSKGVGSKDAMDFIQFQLKVDHTYNEELFYAFKNHLEEIKTNDLKFLSRLDIDADSFLDYLETDIKGCRIYPLDGDETIEIVPEGFIRISDGQLQIQIEDYLADDIVYEPICLTVADTDFSEQMKSYQDEYAELISMLNARKVYMLKVLNIICEVQKDYLLGNSEYLNALDQTVLAEQSDLSAATISRLISNKYISTPRGILPIQSLLSKQCYKSYSVSQVKFIIRNVENYDKLSDNKISLLLNELGIKISRRTVNKYKRQIVGNS